MWAWTSFTSWQIAGAALLGLAIAEFNIYLVTAVVHRGMCHHAIEYPVLLKRAVSVWLWLTVCTSVLGWIAAHLHHHANSDTEKDPHAPCVKGFWRVLLLTWYYVTRWSRVNREQAESRYLKVFGKERLLQFLENPVVVVTYFYLNILVSIVLGPVGIAFWLARFVPYLLASGYVNAVGHTAGERPYGASGTDSVGVWQKLAGYLVGGERLGHNFHHRYPTSPTFRPRNFDPGFWFAVRILRGVPRSSSI